MRIDLEAAHLGIVQTARDNVIAAIKHGEDVVQGTLDSVSELFALSAWGPGTSSDSVASAVTNGALCGAFEMGADLDPVAHGILLGAIGRGSNGAPLGDIIRQTSCGTVRVVAESGGDVSAAIHGLLDAAARSAHARGLDRHHAASAARDGAMLGAAQLNETKSEIVRIALSAPGEPDSFRADEEPVAV